MIYSFTDFLNEKYGQFEGSIKYTDWSEFKDKLKNSISTGFKTEEELVNLMGMDFNKYTKIRENMIFNWKDSVTKSLLHTVAEIGYKIPKEGDNIFRDLKQQTLFCVVAADGAETRNVFGNTNGVPGLNMIHKMIDLAKIKNKDPKNTKFDWDLKKDVMKRFVDFGGIPAYTVLPKSLKKVNDIIQYVWLYAFYHHYIMKKGNIKLPKYLYRGIRTGNFGGKVVDEIRKQSAPSGKHTERVKNYIDSLIDYILKNGISKISDGKFLSFTESRDIAAYFANKEGIILRVDPKKVKIVTSPKTEEFFQEADYVSNKKEKEYIIEIPVNYKFTKDDIEIVHGDYWLGANSPLAVQFFDHDDKKANYTIDGINIQAQYTWKNNTTGSIEFSNLSTDGYDRWGLSRREFKKKFGIDPMPTEENLNKIQDFKISDVKKW